MCITQNANKAVNFGKIMAEISGQRVGDIVHKGVIDAKGEI